MCRLESDRVSDFIILDSENRIWRFYQSTQQPSDSTEMHYPPKMIEKVKFKSLDFGEKVTFADKSEMAVEATNASQRDTSFRDSQLSVSLHDPFLLTKANNAVFFGPAQTLAAPSTSFGLFMTMISAKPRTNNSNSSITPKEVKAGENVGKADGLDANLAPVTEESLWKKFLVSCWLAMNCSDIVGIRVLK